MAWLSSRFSSVSWIALVAMLGLASTSADGRLAAASGSVKANQSPLLGSCCAPGSTGGCCCEPASSESDSTPPISPSCLGRDLAPPVRTCQCRPTAPTAPSPTPDRREPEGRGKSLVVLLDERNEGRELLIQPAPVRRSLARVRTEKQPLYLSLAHFLI